MPSRATHQRLTDWFQWFRRWRAPLRKFLVARWSVAPNDLDDVAQEVFLRLLRYDNTEFIEHPQAYLFRMAANVAGEWAMRARHRHPHDARWLLDLRADSQPDQELAREAAHREVRQALAGLPSRQREFLRLHFGEGLSRAQIAERMGVSERIVKRDLIKAYGTLRTELDADITESLSFESGDPHGPS
jgi:RNA polymerase sigma-70 factor (ECF subfamily)